MSRHYRRGDAKHDQGSELEWVSAPTVWLLVTSLWNSLVFLPLFIAIFVFSQPQHIWASDLIRGVVLWILVIVVAGSRPKVGHIYDNMVIVKPGLHQKEQEFLLLPNAKIVVLPTGLPRVSCFSIVLTSERGSMVLFTLLAVTRSQRLGVGEWGSRIATELGVR